MKGSLDKEVIRRVIHRHLAQFRYCYEKELQIRPTLEGKVKLSFPIGADGAVQQASITENSMAAPAVGDCIAARAKKMLFPKPLGGGVVNVNYPFIFNQAR